MKKLFFVALSVWAFNGLVSAQTVEVHVVKKLIDKTFNYSEGYEVNIEGEKAEVFIETWDQKSIQIELELIAKHTDKAQAEQGLEAMKYMAQRVKNKIYVRNYIKEEEANDALLSARYLVKVPENCPVYLKNYFGQANVSNLSNRLRVTSEFSQIGLENIQGTIDVNTRFGDLKGNDINGNVNIQSRRSDILLTNISGAFDITAQYGVLKIYAGPNLADLNLNLEKSELFFYHIAPEKLAYDISSRESELLIPSNLKMEFQNAANSTRQAQFKPKEEFFAYITIIAAYSDLTIEKLKEKKPITY